MGAGRARPGWAGQGWVEQGRAGQGSPRLPPLFSRRSPAVNGRPTPRRCPEPPAAGWGSGAVARAAAPAAAVPVTKALPGGHTHTHTLTPFTRSHTHRTHSSGAAFAARPLPAPCSAPGSACPRLPEGAEPAAAASSPAERAAGARLPPPLLPGSGVSPGPGTSGSPWAARGASREQPEGPQPPPPPGERSSSPRLRSSWWRLTSRPGSKPTWRRTRSGPSSRWGGLPPAPCPALPCSAPCPRAPPPRPAARLPLCRVAAGPEGQVPLPAQPGDAAGRERAGGLLLAGEPALGTRLSYKKLCGRRLSGRFYPQAYAWEPSFCSRFCLVLRRGTRLGLEMHRCAYFTISVHELWILGI